MVSVSRRRFLQITAGIAALAAATGSATQVLGNSGHGEARARKGGPLRKVPTFCDLCFWKCGAIAYAEGGRLWKIEGNPADPLSRGRLCPRGTAGVAMATDTQRLTRPLLRKKQRGEEVWTAVTWDEALDFIATKMRRIREQHGPESMALFSHGLGGNFLKHTFKAWGTPNITAPSYAQCRGPRDAGFTLTFGEDVGSPERTDIRNARCLTLIGSHLGENMHNTQVQEFAEAVGSGATVIVVDPRYSVVASKAKHYLPIKPGTDMALLLAWMNVLVRENLYDREYVAAHGEGFAEFAADIAPWTPEWAWPITGIAPETIRETAREMARHRPASLVHPGRHVTWYGDDAQRARAVALLNALLGTWGRKGGFYAPTRMSVPPYPYPPYPKSERGTADNPDGKYPFAEEVLSSGIREATLTGRPYPVKGWFVYSTNLMQALPNQEETIKAIQNLDLMVVVDVVGSDIAGWADVVLPEAVYLERYDDLNAELFREPFLALRQPVVPPPADQKPNWWIARELAMRLGLGAYYPWKHVEEYLDTRLKSAGFSLAELKEKGIVPGKPGPLYYEDGLVPEFPTPSGKIEFFSRQLADAGLAPVPRYTPTPEPPEGYFRLLFGRAPVHTFGRTQTNPLLSEMMEENTVWLNEDVANRLGFTSGELVTLRNQDGATAGPVKVRPTQRIRRDCVFLVHGFAQTSKGIAARFKKGASDSRLVTRYVLDPVMGGNGMNVNFVTLERGV
ncbi:MAG: molybdopterin-dependent oxidoreductase [Candidatus Eisenbacteria bacterium]|uniref:Molybdopterin-dependent oxidoreductase n=1 Tax=Eiseniibacteriota bacterium TaxID=2212470 RepID=A0A933W7Z8_UNCEI|nr:molybdopterin-dependent oxidoreductase [Candidatus Eisenbacteria bacterium]